DGIRDFHVTGVQTCALPISAGRLVIVSVDRIATLGTLMIGADISDPNGPGLVIVNVAPVTSSGVSLLDRARLANSEIWRARPTRRSPSASRTLATIRPF